MNYNINKENTWCPAISKSKGFQKEQIGSNWRNEAELWGIIVGGLFFILSSDGVAGIY